MLLPNILAVVAVASTLVAGVPVQLGEHLIARAPPPRAPTWVDRLIAAITPANNPAVLVQHNGRVQKLPQPAKLPESPKKPQLMPLPQIIRGPFKKREPVVIPAGINHDE
ncbi:hypothetical protein HYALB_00005677 [Hymenoscyphus albidus]|uniref:Uncharacterized protein n=1 Tax=Hymenoscyphus albidus TaxID=595503 RepID=A0A9N9Q5E1_9HELO|nr:hypothetical protein HYALB_00005677 [Hymenoscyphus albidus]